MNKVVLRYAILFLVIFIAPICEAKTLTFSVGSDLQYTPAEMSRKQKDVTPKVLSCFIDRMNEERPDFVVFLGSNIEKSKPEYLISFLERIKRIKKPYYIIAGNTDTYKYSGINRETFNKLVSEHSKTQKKYNTNFYFKPTNDILVIGLDSTSLGMPGEHGYFTSETLSWLDETLSKYKNKKVILLQHVPYIEPEKDSSKNILNVKDYESIINKHKNIIMIVSGHYHHYAIQEDEKDIYHISAPALIDEPYDYLTIKINYDKLPLLKPKNFTVNVEKKQSL